MNFSDVTNPHTADTLHFIHDMLVKPHRRWPTGTIDDGFALMRTAREIDRQPEVER